MGISRTSFRFGRLLLATLVLGALAPGGAAAQQGVAAPQAIAFRAPDYWTAKPALLSDVPAPYISGGLAAETPADKRARASARDSASRGSGLPGALSGAEFLAGPAQPEKDGLWPGFGPADLAATMAGIDKEIACLALNIYFEARSESKSGMLAVGKVVMNRVADARFPGTVCKVIRQGGERVLHRCQFSWWCDGQSDQPRDSESWRMARFLAREIYWNRVEDPSRGALWYHADYVSPYWRTAFKRGPQIGRHIFYLDREKRGSFSARPQTASLQ